MGGDRDGNPAGDARSDQRGAAHPARAGVPQAARASSSNSPRPSRTRRPSSASRAPCRPAWKPTEAFVPEVYERYKSLDAEEPYRLKCSYIRQRLVNTRARFAANASHVPGQDYADVDGFLEELRLLRDSLAANRGEAIAGRPLAPHRPSRQDLRVPRRDPGRPRERRMPTTRCWPSSSTDLGELDRPYGELERSERSALLRAELGSARPLGASRSALSPAGATTYGTFESIAAALDRFGDGVIESYVISMTEGDRRRLAHGRPRARGRAHRLP